MNVRRLLRAATLPVVGALVASAPVALLAQGPAVAAGTRRPDVEAYGTVVGRVTDAGGRPLVGAQLFIEPRRDAAAVTITDGRYRARVPAGTQRLTVRYIGFRTETRPVTVRADAVVTLDFRLEAQSTTLATVTVQGQRAGQAAALSQQKAQDVVGNVIDNELVGRLPDQNLAEALQRVPGVALVRDQGEGRFVQIRGINSDLNGLSVNGERVATPEQNSRRVPMDVIPAEQLARIEVSKTLLPDMDADAIGGTVNLVTRTAQAGRPQFYVSGATGQNEINGSRNFNASRGVRPLARRHDLRERAWLRELGRAVVLALDRLTGCQPERLPRRLERWRAGRAGAHRAPRLPAGTPHATGGERDARLAAVGAQPDRAARHVESLRGRRDPLSHALRALGRDLQSAGRQRHPGRHRDRRHRAP
ncbi:MAG: carboxypeptidase regulatory-like domain-containing protein [Gemmatimonadaceae bacterium]|nr:carboxypeptidase regulatory-like domain-containing protein [Gemmatimonadaceae bacterium]